LLETVQSRVRRIAEEANYFDAVLDSMNQVQNGLESLLAEINGFDAFDSQVERVDQELVVSDASILIFVPSHSFVRPSSSSKRKADVAFPHCAFIRQFIPYKWK